MKIPLHFLVLSIIAWVIAFVCYIILGDKIILFFFNHHYNLFLDMLHACLSFFGRGDTIGVFCISLLALPQFRNKISIFYFALFGIATSGIISGLKLLCNVDRPLLVYPNQIHKVMWLDQAYNYSFPSGHTFGAFCFFSFILMAFGIQHKLAQIILFFLAAGCGISRIYLGQHFMSDVLFGASLGTILGYVLGYFAQISFSKNNIKLFPKQ